MPKVLKIAVAYRGIPHSKDWATGDNLARAFKRLGHDVYAYGNYYGTQEKLGAKPLPDELDLLVYCECNDDDPQYTELQQQKAKARVYWDFDVDNGRQGAARQLVEQIGFDVICYANKLYDGYFKKFAPKTVFLPYAFDDKHFHPLNIKPSTNVVIIGTPYDRRLKYVAKLKKLGVDVQFIQGKYREDFVRAINDLKIHLNLNIFGPGGDGLLVARVWETIGCGTFLLTQRKDFIEDFFKDGEHLVLFDTSKECAEKIKYYLSHQKEREKIAIQGYRYGLEHHTYVARAQTILDEVADLLNNPAWAPTPSLRQKAKRILKRN